MLLALAEVKEASVFSRNEPWARMSVDELLDWLRKNYAFIRIEPSGRHPKLEGVTDQTRELPFIGNDDHPYAVGRLAAQILEKEGYPELVQAAGAGAGACHDIGKNHPSMPPADRLPKGDWEPEFRDAYRAGHTRKATNMLQEIPNFGVTESLRGLKQLVGNHHHLWHSDLDKYDFQPTVKDIIAAVKVADYWDGRVDDEKRKHKWITPEKAAQKLGEGAVEGRFQRKAVEAVIEIKLGHGQAARFFDRD